MNIPSFHFETVIFFPILPSVPILKLFLTLQKSGFNLRMTINHHPESMTWIYIKNILRDTKFYQIFTQKLGRLQTPTVLMFALKTMVIL